MLRESTTSLPVGYATSPNQEPASGAGAHLRKTIPELFEEQAPRTPDAVAVVFEGAELTYRDLNERANRPAHYLRELGLEGAIENKHLNVIDSQMRTARQRTGMGGTGVKT